MRPPLKFLVQMPRWWYSVSEVLMDWEEQMKISSRTGKPDSTQTQNTSGR